MKFLDAVKAALSLGPAIIEAAQAAEQLFPQQGAGAAKLEYAVGMIKTGLKIATDLEAQLEQMEPAIATAVSSVVSALNAAGLLGKKAAG